VSGQGAPLLVGSPIALWVVVNSASGQAALAAAEGGDGIHEFTITDDTLDSVAKATARGNAELALFQFALVTVEYTTLDNKTRSGRTVMLNLPSPISLTGSFLIQSVRIDHIQSAPRIMPQYHVTASNSKFSIEDLIRHVVLNV